MHISIGKSEFIRRTVIACFRPVLCHYYATSLHVNYATSLHVNYANSLHVNYATSLHVNYINSLHVNYATSLHVNYINSLHVNYATCLHVLRTTSQTKLLDCKDADTRFTYVTIT